MLSSEGFLSSKRKGLLKHAVDNEVSALARLTFFKSVDWAEQVSPLSVLTGVRFKWVEFRENVRTFARDKQYCP